MRAATQKKIDACHAEIDRLVEVERAWLERTQSSRNSLLANIRDAQLTCAAWSPTQRANARIDTAALPCRGKA